MFRDVLLAVDFDRTLTATDATIPERNIEAIRYFMENGGAFTINTGRSVPMTNWFRDQVSCNAPLLLYNGSAAYEQMEAYLDSRDCKYPNSAKKIAFMMRRYEEDGFTSYWL